MQQSNKTLLGIVTLGLLVVVALGLLFLPKNSWWKCKKEVPQSASAYPAVNDGSPVIVTMNGAPLITENMLNQERENLIKKDPNMQRAAAMYPVEQLNELCLNAMILKILAAKYVKDNGLDQTEEFKNDLNAITDLVYTQTFVKTLPINVTDSDVRTFYNQNKAMLTSAQGGVETVGVKFDSEEKAKQFLTQATTSPLTLNELAKEQNIQDAFRDFGVINNVNCEIDEAICNAVTAITKFPTVTIVHTDNHYWVVSALKKQEPTYLEFETVKAQLKPVVEQQKQADVIGKAIDDLKRDNGLVIDTDFFAKKKKETAALLQKAIAEYETSLQAKQESSDDGCCGEKNSLMTQVA